MRWAGDKGRWNRPIPARVATLAGLPPKKGDRSCEIATAQVKPVPRMGLTILFVAFVVSIRRRTRFIRFCNTG